MKQFFQAFAFSGTIVMNPSLRLPSEMRSLEILPCNPVMCPEPAMKGSFPSISPAQPLWMESFVLWSGALSTALNFPHCTFKAVSLVSCIFWDLFVGLYKLWEHSSLKQCQSDLQVTAEDVIISKGLWEGEGRGCRAERIPFPSKFLYGTEA